jgi:hypothetical protein
VHRAGRLAHSVDRTRLDRFVVVVALELRQQVEVTALAGPLHLAAQHDPLARGRRQILAGAHRLAVAALDAAVHLLLDRCGGLEVPQVGPRIVGQHGPRVEDGVRVHESFEGPHHVVQLVSVLPADEGGHDAAGAMLGLERAAVAEDEVDHVVGERLVAREVRRVVEAFLEKEMHVAIPGVPKITDSS